MGESSEKTTLSSYQTYSGGVKLGGTSSDLQSVLTPRELILIATEHRLSTTEKEIEDACGNHHSKKEVNKILSQLDQQ